MAMPLRASLGFADLVSRSLLSSFSPTIRIPITNTSRFSATLLPFITAAVIPLRIPSLLGDIWESVLRAVPKKKTSHSKKRQRFLASGKALQNVTSLNKCPACGTVKKAHFLCPYCVREIQDMWKGKEPTAEAK